MDTLLIFLVGFLAGIINTLAGGGSLITVPMLIFMGVPSTIANATNRIAILAQNFVTAIEFRRRGLLRSRLLIWLVPTACIGAFFGARLATQVDPRLFQRLFACVVVLCAFLVIKAPKFSPTLHQSTRRKWAASLIFLGIGVYGGFVQAGVGFLIMGTIIGVLGVGFAETNALKVGVVLCYTLVAVILFQQADMIDWPRALNLAAGNVLGGLVGVSLTVHAPLKWIRLGLFIFAVAVAIKLFFTG